MMRYFNRLMLFRLLAVGTAILVAKDFDVIISILLRCLGNSHPEENSHKKSAVNSASLSWDDVDLMIPPKLNNSIAESLRLNELLARKQYKCMESVGIVDARGDFTICYDGRLNRTMSEALFISGSPTDFTSYVTTVVPKKWTFFVPEGFQPLEELGNVDAEMHYLFDLKDYNIWSFNEILSELSKRQFDIAFISFYSPIVRWHSREALQELRNALKLTKQALKILQAEYLHLVIEIDRSLDEVLYGWYLLLYQMYFKYHYALVGAGSDSVCDRTIKKCRYHLSFLKRADYQVELPVFGFGSPLEEKKRLLIYLKSSKQRNMTCNEIGWTENEIPALCKVKAENSSCTVVFVSYRELRRMEYFEQFQPCTVYFFSPLERNFDLTATPLKYSYGISPFHDKNLTISGDRLNSTWVFITLTDMLNIVNEKYINKFILDLDGGEWDIFSALLDTVQLKYVVSDLDLRIRLWVGEENENSRRMLMYLMRLETLGFKKFLSKIVDQTTVIVNFKNTW